VPRLFAAAALLIAGAFTLTAPAAGASEEPIFVSCLQIGDKKPKPQPKSHPHNCFTVAVGVHKSSSFFLLLDLQQISWHRWGSTTAKAVARAVNPEAHTRTKVRFSVTGRQVCEGLTYYARIVPEYPKRLFLHRMSFELSCGSTPEEPGTTG
jgi:hypothetical protein